MDINININMTVKITYPDGEPKEEAEYEKDKTMESKIEENRLIRQRHDLVEHWESQMWTCKHTIRRLEKDIARDIKYLATAEEKNRDKVRIYKRELELQSRRQELLVNQNKLEKMLDLEQVQGVKYFLTVPKNSEEVAFVFDWVNGHINYFDKEGLHDGLPHFYDPSKSKEYQKMF